VTDEPTPDEPAEGEPAEGDEPTEPAEGEPAVDPDEDVNPDHPDGDPDADDAIEGAGDEPGQGEPQAAGPGFGLSPEQAEQVFGKAERKAQDYRKRTVAALDPISEDFVLCPLCLPFAPGFIFDPALAMVEGPQREAVLSAIGEAGDLEVLDAPHARQCDTCGGLGKVKSGSRVQGYETVVCPRCEGRGFMGVTGPTGELPAPPLGNVTEIRPASEAEPAPETDPFGRTPDHPDYGVMPMYVEARRHRMGVA